MGWSRARRIEAAVAGNDIDVAGGIGGRGAPAHPDASPNGVGRDVENARLREFCAVVAIADQPSIVRPIILMRAPSEVDRAVHQRKSRALVLRPGVESDR